MNFAPFAYRQQKVSAPSIDPDAAAYLAAVTAAGGTYATTVADAVNQLFLDLKSYGFYNRLAGLYPFVGGVAGAHAINGVDPSGSGQGSGKLLFYGGWTHDVFGASANGSTAYADTQLEIETDISFPDIHYSFQQNQLSPANSGWDGYYSSGESKVFGMNLSTGGQISLGLFFLAGSLGTLSSYRSIITGVRESAGTGVLYEGTSAFYTDSTTRTAFSTKRNYFIGAMNENGSPNYYNTNRYTFYTLGQKILSSEISDWNTIWNTFLAVKYDSDAESYLYQVRTVGGTTTLSQQTAVNNLFTSLKGTSSTLGGALYNRIVAMYPFVGGTAGAHALNAKNPFSVPDGNGFTGLITFYGGWTHTTSGVTTNGSTSYAVTKVVPRQQVFLSSAHFSFRQTQTSPANSGWDGYYETDDAKVFGLNLNTGGQIGLGLWFLAGSLGSLPNYTDVMTGVRSSSTDGKFYNNDNTFYNDTTTRTDFTSPQYSNGYMIGALAQNGVAAYYNTNIYNFYTLGLSLSSTDIVEWSSIWNTYITEMGR